MAVRNDITVDWNVSPRIVTVAAPSADLSMQDLVDTLRVIEDDFRGMSERSLLEAFGKQPLGGSVSVGITVGLLDAQLEFEARTTPAVTGTISTASSTQVIDNGADFTGDGVRRGDVVINFTDGSVADVLDVIDGNTLNVRNIAGGAENDYDIGDSYKLYQIAAVTSLGGNLTAKDSIGADIEPVLPTFATRMTRALSSDATIVDEATNTTRIADLWWRHGLDPTRPLEITDTSVSGGAVNQTMVYDSGAKKTTVTRTS